MDGRCRSGTSGSTRPGAPYGHFEIKEHLLTQLAIDAWSSLADDVEQLRARMELSGHLAKDTWQVSVEQLVRMLIDVLPRGVDGAD